MSEVRVKTRITSILTISFVKLDGVSFNWEGNRTTINTSPSNAITSGNYILTYRPNYQDVFRSNLGTIFINIEAVYPCVYHHQITCKLFPNELR